MTDNGNASTDQERFAGAGGGCALGTRASPTTDYRIVLCEACGSEGRFYTSRYGGNDPDVIDDGPCPYCEGTGGAVIEVQPIEQDDLAMTIGDPNALDIAATTGCCNTCRCSFWRSDARQTTCWDCCEDHQWDEEAVP